MALVTADLRLDFGDLPQASHEDVTRAVWRAHHLPHNVDRVLDLPATEPAVRVKRELLTHMDDDRDPRRRRAAFTLLHRLNEELAGEHAPALESARRDVDRARQGLNNAALTRRRDWSCLLHPAERLIDLRKHVESNRGQLEASP